MSEIQIPIDFYCNLEIVLGQMVQCGTNTLEIDNIRIRQVGEQRDTGGTIQKFTIERCIK